MCILDNAAWIRTCTNEILGDLTTYPQTSASVSAVFILFLFEQTCSHFNTKAIIIDSYYYLPLAFLRQVCFVVDDCLELTEFSSQP